MRRITGLILQIMYLCIEFHLNIARVPSFEKEDYYYDDVTLLWCSSKFVLLVEGEGGRVG